MNPASRVFNFVDKLKIQRDDSKQMVQVYYEILEVEDPYSLYTSLKIVANEVNKIEDILKASNKTEKYKNFLILIKEVITPYNLKAPLNTIRNAINTVHPILMVLEDSLENQQFGETDISDKLKDIETDLDNFLKKINSLKISDEEKLLYAKITLKLKESIKLYELGGADELSTNIKVFECITKDSKEAAPITEKLLIALSAASATTGLISFATGKDLTQLLLTGN